MAGEGTLDGQMEQGFAALVAALRYALVRLFAEERDPNKLVAGAARALSAAATGLRAGIAGDEHAAA